MQPIRIAVIMAGGSGERFWPLSRRSRPKQLLRLTSPERNMLEESISRITPLIPLARIFIATSRELEGPIRAAKTGVPPENVLAEPCKRNTAGCIAYAAQILARFGLENASTVTMAILTADHQIGVLDRFRQVVETACETAETKNALVTIGIPPTRPDSGLGYIELPQGSAASQKQSGTPRSHYPIAGFREKPDLATAQEYVKQSRFFWNSGMFFWQLDTLLSELDHASPAHAQAAREMAEALARGDTPEAERLCKELTDISIDYALMEKSRNVGMVEGDFPWDDVGAWDALDRSYAHDTQGNVAVGDPVLIDTRDCIVYNEPGAQKMAVATIGVEGLAVIISADGVLIIPKDRAQDVRKAVAALKERGAGQL